MYSPANRGFPFPEVEVLIMCTQCSLQLPETNTLYMQCILGVIIIIWLKNNDNYKVMFYFLSPNVLLLFVF